MALTWITTPGSDLDDDAAIVFTTDDDPSEMIIHMKSDDFWEVIFASGSFSPLYQSSTMELDGGLYTFTLRRLAGWPRDPDTGGATVVEVFAGSGGGGLITSVFGRVGDVVASAGDYTTDQITNASSVEGSTETAALNNLASTLAIKADDNAVVHTTDNVAGDLSGNVLAPTVTKIRGVNVSATAPSDGDRLVYNEGTGQWEPTAVTAEEGTWQTAYEVDFATLATAAFGSGDGAYPIDGRTWNLVNSGALDSAGLVNGTGLVLDFGAVSTNWTGSTNNSSYLWVPLLDLSAELYWSDISALRASVQYEATGLDALYETAYVALGRYPWSSSNRFAWVARNTFGSLGDSWVLYADIAGTSTAGVVPYTGDDVMGVTLSSLMTGYGEYGAYAAGWPAPADRHQIAAYGASGMATGLDSQANFGLALGGFTVNSSNTLVVTFKKLIVEYMV